MKKTIPLALALIIPLAFLPPVSSGRTALRLEVEAPEDCIELGAPFTVEVYLYNPGVEPVRVAPLFVMSRDYMTINFSNQEAALIETGDLVVNPRIEENFFVLLFEDFFIGQKVRLSPLLSEVGMYPYGVSSGEYQVSATLRLHSYLNEFSWSDGYIPIEAVLESEADSVCFAPPSDSSILKYRQLLKSPEEEEIVDALSYFASVPDRKAVEFIRKLIGPAEGWSSRFFYPMGAALALRRYCDSNNIPYFEDLVGGRYGRFGEEALAEIQLTCPPSANGVRQ